VLVRVGGQVQEVLWPSPLSFRRRYGCARAKWGARLSEYQYYEFVAIDRPLNERELGEVRALSTRAHITPTSFVNTYEWGNFRGNPDVLMERYYDAFLHLTNWGTRWLSFRVPVRMLDHPTAQRYCVGHSASARVSGEHLVIDLISEDEGGEELDWGGEGRLSSIIPVRAELVGGDLRLLYLAWLFCVQDRQVPDEEVEPPVPSGLGTLTASLKAVAEFLRIDPDLLFVARHVSTVDTPADDMAAWVEGMPAAEKDAALLTLLRGDDPHLRAGLLRRFRGTAPVGPGNRTAGDLRSAAEARWKDRVRALEERKRQAAAERERARVAERARRLATLAAEGDRVWARIDALIETKKPAEYERAVDMLNDLQDVAESAEFDRRVAELRVRHARKPSLMDRFDRAGLP
jgi:hypothetical protein